MSGYQSDDEREMSGDKTVQNNSSNKRIKKQVQNEEQASLHINPTDGIDFLNKLSEQLKSFKGELHIHVHSGK